jgi:hypothetical protein
MADKLKGLKPGMWIRLRNVHIDQPAVEKLLSSFSPPVIDLDGDGQDGSSSSGSSGSGTTWMVGTVQSDSHISLLLPYFKYVLLGLEREKKRED